MNTNNVSQPPKRDKVIHIRVSQRTIDRLKALGDTTSKHIRTAIIKYLKQAEEKSDNTLEN